MLAPRVFISYSHDSEAHRDAVLQLAQRLRSDGIDVRLDRFEPVPSLGWARWMIEQVEDAELVIVVCTDTYRQRFDGRAAPGIGKGVSFEGLLSIQYLYDANARNEKFIPIVLPNAGMEPIPLVLRPYSRYEYPQQYDELYRHLTAQPEVVAAPLGVRRVVPPRNGAAWSSMSTQEPVSRTTSTHGGFHFQKVGGKIDIQAGRDIVAGDKITGPRRPLDSGVVHSNGSGDVVVERIELLYRLLQGLFTSGDEFRNWIARGPDGNMLSAALPGGSASASAVIFNGLDVLHCRGYIDAELFSRLSADFARRAADIQRVASEWGVQVTVKGDTNTPMQSGGSGTSPSTHGGFHFGSVRGNVTVKAGDDIVAGDRSKDNSSAVVPAASDPHVAIDALKIALAEIGGAGALEDD